MTDAEIKEFCQANYGIDFLMSKKIEVNGDDAHPLFKYLVSECDVDSVPWNFTKFLVNEDEIVLMAPHTTPEEIDVALLKIEGNNFPFLAFSNGPARRWIGPRKNQSQKNYGLGFSRV